MPDQPSPAATKVIDLTSGQGSVQLDRNRAEMMDFLYDLYERDKAPQGLRSTYTGLMEQFKADLADFMITEIERDWEDGVWRAAIAGMLAPDATDSAKADASAPLS